MNDTANVNKKKKYSNSLIIISGETLPENSCIDFDSSDVLALSLPTMAILDQNKINYETLEDFFSPEDSYKDTNDFASALRLWLEQCDRLCEKNIKIKRTFSSNGFWFLHRLSDLRYIHSILDRVTDKYVNIQMIAPIKIENLPPPMVSFSTLHFPFFGFGINHLLSFLKAGAPDVNIHFASEKIQRQRGLLGAPFSHFLRRLPEIILRRGVSFVRSFSFNQKIESEQYWVAQGGYDVDILKSNWKDKNFNYILPSLVNSTNEFHETKNTELTSELVSVSEKFIITWLPRYSDWLIKFIFNYIQSIALRLPELEKKTYEWISTDKPKGVFYSIGIQNVVEETVARIANKSFIPVYTFKHGGIGNQFLLPSILDEYAEKNTAIVRMHFVHNQSEKEDFEKIYNVTPIVVGVLDKPTKHESNNSKKILFSAGAPAHYSFKETRKGCSDYERYEFSEYLVTLCSEMEMPLDIKVHPAEWDIGFSFFNILKRKINESKNITVLAGGSIERILGGYGLIVLDMLSSRVLTGSFYLNVPIVVFIPKHFPVNLKYFDDLNKRVYVVHDKEELRFVLESFYNGTLDSNFDTDFQQNYLSYNSTVSEISEVKKYILTNEMNL